MRYWEDNFDDESAASYMETYGEGVGSDTRHMLGTFINDGESILDVGCGPGWNWDHFKEHGPKISKYLGLDYSKRFVRVANQRNPGMYRVGDVRNLTRYNREEFSVVILQDVLEHTNGYEKPVQEALRVSKKRVIITFWRMTEGETDTINDDGDDTWGAAYSRPKWEKFLDSLDLHWLMEESEPTANRQHWFYVIDKEVKHG